LSVVAIGLVTGAVFLLRPIAPVLSLGVLYVIAVVAVAVLRGLVYAVPVAVGSMLAFNFFFLPPVHTLALHESANWVALCVYLVTAVVVGELATRSRRLAREAVEAETLRQTDAVKTAVLRSVSHDLRSPLTAIRAAAESLSGSLGLGAADRDELLETIAIEVRRLERLVDNLLDLSRLEAGPAMRQPEVWPVDVLAARALDHLGEDGDRVRIELPSDLDPVHVDAGHAERVLVNLLENSLKFSSRADPVELSASEIGGSVQIRVRDRGPGVREEDRERIFEPFERGADSVGGTGLGLAIAKGFAEANRGRVWVEPGGSAGGAVFVFALPAVGEEAVVPQ
jgi:two-component system, OmpR family, sensor histidine kinase KdpD